MIHICVHKFKDGKMVVPEPCFTVKELNARFDELAQASRDRNYGVTNDIFNVGMECDGFTIHNQDGELIFGWSQDEAFGAGMRDLLNYLGFEATEQEVY